MDKEHSKIIVPRAFAKELKQAMDSCACVYLCAPAGWGKTSVIEKLLEKTPHTYISLWDQDALKQVSDDAAGLVVLDDFQAVYDYKERQAAVAELLRACPAGPRYLLLSRAEVPEWLLPFQKTRRMAYIPYTSLALNAQESQALLKAREYPVPAPDGLLRVLELTKGNPSLLIVLGGCLPEDGQLTEKVIGDARESFFALLDRRLFRQWDPAEQRLMLLSSFYESFTVDMACVLTGSRNAKAILERMMGTGNFLLQEGDAFRHRFHLIRRWLRHKAFQVYRDENEMRGVYDILSLCCQLFGDLPAAIEYSVKAKDRIRAAELMTVYIRNSPKDGVRTLRSCWRELSEYDREEIPELLCGMSMLRAMDGLPEESEQFAERLKRYIADRHDRGHAAHRARCMYAYLALHLPHRSSAQRAEDLLWIAERQERGTLRLPEFSITDGQPSVLRGLWDLSGWQAEDAPSFQQLLAQHYGSTALDALTILRAERAYEKGEYPWGSVAELASAQINAQRAKQTGLELASIVLSSRVVCTQRDHSLAYSIASSFQDKIKEYGPAGLLPYANALLCRVSLLGDCVYADAWYEEQASESAEASVCYLCLTRVRCCIRRQAYEEASSLLARLFVHLHMQNSVLNLIEALILSAICQRSMKAERTVWHRTLTEAVKRAQEYGYTALFAEMGAAVLPLLKELKWEGHEGFWALLREQARQQAMRYPGYLSAPGAQTAQQSGPPVWLLDEQEETLFHALCRRKTNEQIRQAMGLSVRQFSKLTNRLYDKLNTKSRKRIREMGAMLMDSDSETD